MLELNLNPSDRVLRQFAAAWLVALGIIAAEQWLVRSHPRAAALVLVAAILGGVTGLLWPRAIRWLFVGCTVVAFPIGWVLSQVMLLVLFLAVITPIALLLRLQGRDRLLRKRTAGQTSYWKPKPTPQDTRRYLRQY